MESLNMTPPENTTGRVDKFRIFRHVRNGVQGDGLHPDITSPRGGVTFYVEVDFTVDPAQLVFATCVQRDDKNFKYKLGRDVSKGRFDSGQALRVDYDPESSLIENIEDVLYSVTHLHNSDGEFSDPEYVKSVEAGIKAAGIDINVLRTAYSTLRKYTRNLPRQHPGQPRD